MRESSCCCEQQNTNKTSHKILLIKFDSSYHNRPKKYFNPRSPCGERPRAWAFPARILHFNPRSPCGERLRPKIICLCGPNCISIHAPRVGSDARCIIWSRSRDQFQSTLPVWGATTARGQCQHLPPAISIHAPRVGSDGVYTGVYPYWYSISIHAPRVGSDLWLP